MQAGSEHVYMFMIIKAKEGRENFSLMMIIKIR